MRSVSVRLADLNKVTIPIGFVGENLHTQVRVDCVKLFEEYPNAVPTLTVNPPMGDTYPAIVTRDGDYVIWEVEDSDLIYNGNGEIQLTFSVDEVVAKSYISRIRIEKSLVPTGEVPTPIENWIDEANEILAEAEKWEDVTAEAETLATGEPASVEIVEESGHNKFVFGLPKGEEGEPGTPGFSPVIVVTDITGGHRVSITDVGGTHTVDIMDGEKGDTGNGIASAVLNQDYTLTLNFTDGTHYTTPSIRGAKGDKGDTGNGIASIALNQDYTLTITYTNGQSTTTTSIRGEKGETGVTPVISIGTVTTLQPGSDATASMDVTDPEHPVLSFGIPEGEPGEVTEAELTAVAESKAPVIINEASGAIASFSDGADGMLVKTLEVDIDPVQDLHGQNSPYPAGGSPQRWDEEWESGSINPSTGANANDNTRIRSKNYIPVLPSTVYYCKSSKDLALRYYGSDKSFIGTGSARNSTVTTPENCYYMRFAVVDTTSYGNDISINYPATETAYYSYSNVCPISGWDSAEVSRTGVNVWDEETRSGYYDSVTGEFKSQSSTLANKNMIPVMPNTTYYCKSGTYHVSIVFYDSNKNFITGGGGYHKENATFITPNNCHFINFYTDYGSGGTYNNDISINYPATDHNYHPGQVRQIEYEFPQEAGTVYGGELTIHQDGSGTLVVDHKVKTLIGNENWSLENSDNFYTDIVEGAKKPQLVRCSVFKSAYTSYVSGIENIWISSSGRINLTFPEIPHEANALNTFLANLNTAGTPVQIVYELATPVTYQLTNQQVIELLKGVNNVWADTGNVALEYPADTKLYIDGKVAELQALILENISNS